MRLEILLAQLKFTIKDIRDILYVIKYKGLYEKEENNALYKIVFSEKMNALSEEAQVAWDKIIEDWKEPEFGDVGEKLFSEAAVITLDGKALNKKISKDNEDSYFSVSWEDGVNRGLPFLKKIVNKQLNFIKQSISHNSSRLHIDYIYNIIGPRFQNLMRGTGGLGELTNDVSLTEIEEIIDIIREYEEKIQAVGASLGLQTFNFVKDIEENDTFYKGILLAEAYEVACGNRSQFGESGKKIIENNNFPNEQWFRDALRLAYVKKLLEI